MTQVILTGDSHLGPLKRAMAQDPKPFDFWPLGRGSGARKRFFDATNKAVRITLPDWEPVTFNAQTLQPIAPDGLLVLSLPMNTSRLLRDYPWQSHAPWQVARNEQALSSAVISALIENDSRHALDFAIALKAVWPRLAVLEAPRFFANASYLRRHRVEICRYLDGVYRAEVAAKLGAHGIGVIHQPADTIAEDGTTRLEFDHEDPADDHHGNAAFGRRMLDAVAAYAGGR